MAEVAKEPGGSLVTETGASPHVRLRAVGFREVRWTAGFWAERFAVCRERMVPVMRELMEGTERSQFLQNLKIAAGEADGRHRGPRWNDGDFYKWLEGAVAVSAVAPDAELDAAVDGMIAVIAKAQRGDGYIHSPQIINWRSGGDLPPLANPMDFEMYNMGHLVTAAVVHHRATGKDSLLKVAMRAADFLDRTFAAPTPAVARHGICPSHLMALVELYRETGHRPYLELAVRLLNMRDMVRGGDDDNQDRVPLREETRAVGHAVRGTYLWASAADVYAETGEAALLSTLEAIWSDLVTKKLYITGGCGALFDGASPDGASDQQNITRVHQAFGRDYQLPNSTAHNETCAAVGSVMWNWRMLQITGEAKYGDLIETTLYNAVLAGVDLGGTKWFYTNTLRNLRPMPVALRWNRKREEFIGCFCCPPNVVRTLAEVAGYAYLKSEGGVSVVLYGGNELDTRLADGTRVTLRQETAYPWEGRVKFTIGADGEYGIRLRIPAWARGAKVTVAGGSADDARAGEWHEVRRAWRAGDVLVLDLPVEARLVEAHPFVEEARNHVAVVRGPVVYCVESADLPAGVKVMDVRVRRGTRLEVGAAEGLDGVVAVRAEGMVKGEGEWGGALYREVAEGVDGKAARLTLVPYFAWDNRGESEMTVWVPVT